MSFPLTYILSVAICFDIPFSACINILLSPLFYVTSALAIAVGYGLWEMRRWAWYLLIVTNIFIGYSNAVIVHDYSESHYKGLVFIASVVVMLAVLFRLSREIRVPYFFPKIRWWESNPRYRLTVPVNIQHGQLGAVQAQILDLSLGGCFIKMRSDIRQDDIVQLSFSVFDHPMACQGVVVWCTQGAVTHPRGVGVKFIHLAKTQKRALRLITRRLKKIATFYRRSRYLLNQDEFNKKLEEIESHTIRTG